MKQPLFPTVAEVRPAEDLDALAVAINAAHEAGEGAARKGMEYFRTAGEALLKAKEQCGHGKWKAWLKKNVKVPYRTAAKYMALAKCAVTAHLEEQWRVISGNVPTEDEDDDAPPIPEFVTLTDWQEAGADVRKRLLTAQGDAKFNTQGDNDNIEWALWSWNPVTGCLHNCPYCYARDIAERFYDQKFTPSLWPGRLHAPRNTPFPEQKAAEWMGHKNVFVCSMADLFGRWVPAEWIEAVLAEVRAAPQWNFLFLTKFPVRMAEFDFPDNAWVGTTVDCQARVANAERSFRKVKAGIKWLSVEPLIEPLTFSDLGAFQWIVIGGASASSQTPKWTPPRTWVEDIENAARAAGVPFYEKTNLSARVRQYPGEEPHTDLARAPKQLVYLPQAEAK